MPKMLPWQYQCVSNVMVDIFDTAHGFTNRSLDKQKVKPRKFVADNLRDGSSYFFNSRPSITIKKRSEPSNELHKELDSKDDVLVRRIRENLPVSIGGKGGLGVWGPSASSRPSHTLIVRSSKHVRPPNDAPPHTSM